LLPRRSWLRPYRLVVVGNLIKCSDFCPGVGEVRGSSTLTLGHASRSPSIGRASLVRDRAWPRCSRRGCLVRVGAGARSRRSVEPASYKTDLVYGLRWAAFCCGLVILFFIIDDVGTPILLVPTVAPEPLGECVITLPEACLLMNWGRSVIVFSSGGARAHPPSVAPEASVEC
jgi:hypothetical protein